MGNEYSANRNRTLTPYEEGMAHQFMNNLLPLRFHPVHGENVKISRNGAVACRAEGFCKGIAFSNRPVRVNEYVYIKFLDISSSWSGALRIGFTMNDPACFRSKLPRYACPCLTDMTGNWARALAERFVKKDSIVFYYVDQNGDVHYGFDNEDKGVFFGGVNTSNKLWAVLDIYGNTVSIEFMDPRLLTNQRPEQHEVGNDGDAIQMNNRTEYESSNSGVDDFVLTPLCFHWHHGKNVTLNRTRFVASRRQGVLNQGYAFTERPLHINEKLVIKVLQTDPSYEGNLILGVTSCNPSQIDPEELPDDFDDLLDRPEYWVCTRDSDECTAGDILIYFIDSEGEFRFSKNGNDSTTLMFVDHTLPLWLFVALYGSTSEIKIEGTSEMDPTLYGLDAGLSANLSVSLPPVTGKKAVSGNMPSYPSSSENVSECVICYEEVVNCVLYRCGHMCMCYKCAMQLWKSGSNVHCPICRKPIEDVIKTFK